MQLTTNFRFPFLFSSLLLLSLSFTAMSCEGEKDMAEVTTDITEIPKGSPDSTPPKMPETEVVRGPRLCDECEVFEFSGMQREYLFHIPDDLPDNAPLVFMLHGSGGKASNFQGWLQMDAIADTEKFAVAYPQGVEAGVVGTHWNAGLTISTVDDVGYLSALAQFLQTEFTLNPEQTFVSGYSNGGFMGYELLSERPDVFKAAASYNGTMSGKTWNNRAKIAPAPILQLSGALDEVVPVDGSRSTAGGWGGAPDMAAVMDFWGELNNCNTSKTTRINENTVALKFTEGTDGNEVWYYLLDGFGHEFPLGENDNLHTAELVWEFFSKY